MWIGLTIAACAFAVLIIGAILADLGDDQWPDLDYEDDDLDLDDDDPQGGAPIV